MGKKNIKTRIKDKIIFEAFKKHLWIEKTNSKAELENFINRFKKNYISCELIRVGAEGDGGYLLPNILKDIRYCYSPGVNDNTSFEEELSAKYNIKSFMADASVDKAPISGSNFEFISKYLGACSYNRFITLSDWINETSGFNDIGKILQMDIEGSEYDVLIFEDGKTLSSFSTMIIEFHFLQNIFKEDFLRTISSILEKIYKYFSICHVHPNNIGGLVELDGIQVPRVMEITFIRNDYIEQCSNNKNIILPNILDVKNSKNMQDIIMPEIWWKK